MVVSWRTPPWRRLVFSYAMKDLLRNPRRTLSALAGVGLAVGLVAATAFFVDASAARIAGRALSPAALDMQAELSAPLASPPQSTVPLKAGSSPSTALRTTVTLIGVNGSA